MNILYTSQKLHELFCEDSLPNHAHASGDGDGVPGRCCRLCGGDNNLRYFGDTYVWKGVEERYDQLLDDCFGVKVTPSDCMICEWCVRALRTTGRFRALVHAAFDDQNSELSSDLTLKSSSRKKDVKSIQKPEKDPLPPKSIDLVRKRDDRKRFLLGGEAKAKRINIACDICKQRIARLSSINPQSLNYERPCHKIHAHILKNRSEKVALILHIRYPMLINPKETYKTFVCSRCKKNGELKGSSTCGKCNVMMPSNLMADHLELHVKADLRGKFREQERKRVVQPSLPRKVIPSEPVKPRPQKYQCSQCAKKYTFARQLAMHVRNAHGDTMDNICAVCNEDMETNEKLQEHLLQHSGLHQCDECLLIFKNKKTLAAHITKHHVGYAAS